MASIKELRAACRKPGGYEAVKEKILLRIIRVFSIYLTWFFLCFKKITADHVTIASVAMFVLGAFCYVWGYYWLNLIGLALIWFSIVMDFSDGEVARYKRGSLEKTDPERFKILQLKGSVLEGWTHDIKYGVLFLFLAVGEYSSFPYPSLLILLGFSASMSQVLSRLTKLRYIHNFFPIKSAEEAYQEMSRKSMFAKQGGLRKFLSNTFGATSEIAIWLTLATIIDKVYALVIFYGIFFSAAYFVLALKQYKGFKKI